MVYGAALWLVYWGALWLVYLGAWGKIQEFLHRMKVIVHMIFNSNLNFDSFLQT